MRQTSQMRFYDVSEFFRDDERIMAHAIIRYRQTTVKAEDIYTDLLDCDTDKWVEALEWVIDNISHSALNEWMDKAVQGFKSGMWIKGDDEMLTERAWKLKSYEKPRSKAHAVKIKRQMTFYDLGW